MGRRQVGAQRRARLLVPVLVLVALVVAVVASLGAPLVPTLAEVEDVSLASAQWSLTIALLVGAVATPLMGRLADGPRRKAMILTVLALATAGCALAALPLGFPYLLAGRALQGAGLGLTPVMIAVARDHLSGERVAAAVAALSISTVAGLGLGYTVTGLLTRYGSLHLAFGVGAAICATALVLAVVVVPPSSGRPRRPMDVPGLLLLAASLSSLLLFLGRVGRWDRPVPLLVALAAVSLATAALWVLRELRAAHPLVDLRLARSRPVLTSAVAAVLAGVGIYLMIAMSTQLVQTPASTGYGHGSSVVVGGLVLLPFSMTGFLASRAVQRLTRTFVPGTLLPLGCLVALASMVTFALARSSLWQVFVVTAICGFGTGIAFAAIPLLIVPAVPPTETGSALGFNQVLRTAGFAVGSALTAAILDAYTPRGARLPEAGGYDVAALAACGIWVATAVLSAVLLRVGRRPAAPVTRDRVPAG